MPSATASPDSRCPALLPTGLVLLPPLRGAVRVVLSPPMDPHPTRRYLTGSALHGRPRSQLHQGFTKAGSARGRRPAQRVSAGAILLRRHSTTGTAPARATAFGAAVRAAD